MLTLTSPASVILTTPYLKHILILFHLTTQVRLQEMRESVRIIYQCINQMPTGMYKSPDNKVSSEGSICYSSIGCSRDHASYLATVLQQLFHGAAKNPAANL
jgi:NADH:ubiquinone oxidoreductase subunit D